jgi:DNA repair protein RadD
MNLRPYQYEAINSLRAGIRQGHHAQILCAPTGSGKTVIASHLIAEATAKLTRSVFICDRVELVHQTSSTFDGHGIAHGILQADHWRARPWERIQVASAQTLARRGTPDGIRLAVVDEAHTLYKGTVDFIQRNPSIIVIGLTATPFTKGLGKIYTRVVNSTTTDQLVADSFLAPVKAYAAKRIDMTGAKVKFNGEWDDDDIEEKALVIVGDVVSCWVEKTAHHFNGPVKTIVFAATVAHGEELCRQFQVAGFNFQQISYRDKNEDRRRALINEFRKPDSEIIGLVSCEALAKGFDVPDILCGISCRPYRKSLSGHIQQMGRVMRAFPGKEFALWLDHGGNYLRFAEDTAGVFANGVNSLNDCDLDNKVRPDPEVLEYSNACEGCGYVMAKADLCCPSCGKDRPRRQNTIDHKPGELTEVSLKGKASQRPEWMVDKELVWRQIIGYALGVKGGDVEKANKFALAQFRNLYGEWPYRRMDSVEPLDPSIKVVNKIRSQMIAFGKRSRVAA